MSATNCHHLDPTSNAPAPTVAGVSSQEEARSGGSNKVIIITHDISLGSMIQQFSAANSQEHSQKWRRAKTTFTLRLTNDCSLTTMPVIHDLPEVVQRVECEESCSTITKIDPTAYEPSFSFLRPPTVGFLRNCRGLKSFDMRNMPRLMKFGPNFLSGCTRLETITFPHKHEKQTEDTAVTIGPSFLEGCLALNNIDLSYFTDIAVIPRGFLSNTGLVHLTVPVFPHLQTIDDEFLFRCGWLKTLVFSSSSLTADEVLSTTSEASARGNCWQLKHIKNGFLSQCVKLEQVDLGPLSSSSLASVGDHFLADCSALTQLLLHPEASFTVGRSFLNDCKLLSCVDLRFFRENGQQMVPDHFLYKCRSLQTVDLEPMNNVVRAGKAVFGYCSALQELDISCWTQLTYVKEYFAIECQQLTTVRFPTAQQCATIGCDFLRGDTNLASIDGFDQFVSPLSFVNCIPSRFLNNCQSLKRVDLRGFVGVDDIQDRFLEGCASLEVVDMSALTRVSYIGVAFLGGASSLRQLILPSTFTPHPSVQHMAIGDDFLRGCAELETIKSTTTSSSCVGVADLSAFCTVKNVNSNFMFGCTSITSVDLSSWECVTHLGQSFLSNCSQLRSVQFPPPRLHSTTVVVDRSEKPFKTPPVITAKFLAHCTALESIDLRLFDGAEHGAHPFADASPQVLTSIVVAPPREKKEEGEEVPTRSFGTIPVPMSLDSKLRPNVIECGRDEAIPHLQWSWKDHHRHPKGVQLAVLWMFSGLEYNHGGGGGGQMTKKKRPAVVDGDDDVHHNGGAAARQLPSEVAYEISRFIGSPATEVLGNKQHTQKTKMKFGGGFSGAKFTFKKSK